MERKPGIKVHTKPTTSITGKLLQQAEIKQSQEDAYVSR
jgi:hypothetical protein